VYKSRLAAVAEHSTIISINITIIIVIVIIIISELLSVTTNHRSQLCYHTDTITAAV